MAATSVLRQFGTLDVFVLPALCAIFMSLLLETTVRLKSRGKAFRALSVKKWNDSACLDSQQLFPSLFKSLMALLTNSPDPPETPS